MGWSMDPGPCFVYVPTDTVLTTKRDRLHTGEHYDGRTIKLLPATEAMMPRAPH